MLKAFSSQSSIRAFHGQAAIAQVGAFENVQRLPHLRTSEPRIRAAQGSDELIVTSHGTKAFNLFPQCSSAPSSCLNLTNPYLNALSSKRLITSILLRQPASPAAFRGRAIAPTDSRSPPLRHTWVSPVQADGSQGCPTEGRTVSVDGQPPSASRATSDCRP